VELAEIPRSSILQRRSRGGLRYTAGRAIAQREDILGANREVLGTHIGIMHILHLARPPGPEPDFEAYWKLWNFTGF
jgi:hypothetical protein